MSSAAAKCASEFWAEQVLVHQKSLDQGELDKTDEWLIQEIGKQKCEALGELFHRHWRRLYNIVSRVLENESEAEELVQEIFIYVWTRAHKFDSEKSPATFWLSQVAYCRALDRRDYLKARRFYDSVEGSDLFDRFPSNGSVEDEIARSELRRQLASALSHLRRDQQMTLELFFFEGYTLAEISQYLGEPLGNIRHHYYRGLETLRRKFKGADKAFPLPAARKRS